MKKIISLIVGLAFFISMVSFAAPTPPGEFYEITVYRYNSSSQEKMIEQYLEKAYLPALHRAGIEHVGVFKSVANDTAQQKLLFVLLPLRTAVAGTELQSVLDKDAEYKKQGSEYLRAVHTQPPYQRMEKILLQAFKNMPLHRLSKAGENNQNRIYELRSYEGHTEMINRNKIEMFNDGGEIALFERLGFNAIFYGEVLYGARMPNLMYMTSFEDMQQRDAHWKKFSDDPEWKILASDKRYQNNVSKIDIYLLKAAAYSDM